MIKIKNPLTVSQKKEIEKVFLNTLHKRFSISDGAEVSKKRILAAFIKQANKFNLRTVSAECLECLIWGQAFNLESRKKARLDNIDRLMLTALHYFCEQVDIIPDWEINGYADDAYAINFALTKIKRMNPNYYQLLLLQYYEYRDNQRL